LFADANVIKDRNNLDWFVGEIYITDDDVIPDTNRRNFQLSDHSRQVIQAIQEFYTRTAARARGWSWEVLVRDACADIDDIAVQAPMLLAEISQSKKGSKTGSRKIKRASRSAGQPAERLAKEWIRLREARQRLDEAKTKANAPGSDRVGPGERAIREYLRKPDVKALIAGAEGKASKLEATLHKEAPAVESLVERRETSEAKRKPKTKRRAKSGSSARDNGADDGTESQSDRSSQPVDLDTVKIACLAAVAAVVGPDSDAYRRIAARLDEELRRRGIGLDAA
jgi:hypothetical protein